MPPVHPFFARLLHDFPGNKKLAALRSGVESLVRWDENLKQNALPVMSHAAFQASNSSLRLVLFVGMLLLFPISVAMAVAYIAGYR